MECIHRCAIDRSSADKADNGVELRAGLVKRVAPDGITSFIGDRAIKYSVLESRSRALKSYLEAMHTQLHEQQDVAVL